MPSEKLIQLFYNSRLVSLSIAHEIANQFYPRSILRHEFFLTEGQVSDEYLFLETGGMRSFAHNLEGNEVTTGFYQNGDVVFEVSSFFNRTKSKENIQALTDCSGWCITYNDLNTLFHTLPEFREFGRAVLVKGFAGLKSRTLSMITETAEERYAQLIKSNPEIFQYAALKHIASYLGITDTSLSRIRKEFAKR